MDTINTIKDLGPIIVGITALIVADRHISKQARLSAKVQWIENFRVNTVKMLTKHYNFLCAVEQSEPNSYRRAYTDFIEQLSILRIYLKKDINNHIKLRDDLNALITLVKEADLNMTSISNKVGLIYYQCETVLAESESKL